LVSNEEETPVQPVQSRDQHHFLLTLTPSDRLDMENVFIFNSSSEIYIRGWCSTEKLAIARTTISCQKWKRTVVTLMHLFSYIE